jgi:predicted DNA-binding protein
MNKKIDKRKFVRLSGVAHNRIKELSKTTGVKLERIVDDAVFMYLKMHVTSPIRMDRGTGE